MNVWCSPHRGSGVYLYPLHEAAREEEPMPEPVVKVYESAAVERAKLLVRADKQYRAWRRASKTTRRFMPFDEWQAATQEEQPVKLGVTRSGQTLGTCQQAPRLAVKLGVTRR